MENNGNIHIGHLIREQLKADQRSASWLAREIGCSRNHLLLSISLAMNFNFFQYYTAEFIEGMKARIG